MYKLNEQSQKNIYKNTGLTVDQISLMDIEEIDKALEKRLKKKLVFRLDKNPRLIGRGSIYLDLGRLLPINKINKRLTKIK